MINIDNISSELPFQKFKETYEAALKANQANIEAICISSFSKKLNEVNSRFVISTKCQLTVMKAHLQYYLNHKT